MASRRTSKAAEIVRRLKEEYPQATTQLIHKNTFQLLVATILSAQATDRQVNRVLKDLFKKFKTPEDFANAKLSELKRIIKPSGYYNQKARNIRKSARIILEEYSGRVPDSMNELIKLPGVGRKTANIVLSYGFGRDEGIAVDTHVFRLSRRLGLSNKNSPEKVEIDLLEKIPKKDWNIVNISFIWHGRKVCTARNPKHKHCILFNLCPSRNL